MAFVSQDVKPGDDEGEAPFAARAFEKPINPSESR